MLDGVRYKEFNFCSDYEGTGLEMRGTNILNVKTWKEFKEQMTILFETAEYVESVFKKKFTIVKNIKFDENDYNQMVRDREPIIIRDDRDYDSREHSRDNTRARINRAYLNSEIDEPQFLRLMSELNYRDNEYEYEEENDNEDN
jgi:hypothetical protein